VCHYELLVALSTPVCAPDCHVLGTIVTGVAFAARGAVRTLCTATSAACVLAPRSLRDTSAIRCAIVCDEAPLHTALCALDCVCAFGELV
jgi:hypothetical protein